MPLRAFGICRRPAARRSGGFVPIAFPEPWRSRENALGPKRLAPNVARKLQRRQVMRDRIRRSVYAVAVIAGIALASTVAGAEDTLKLAVGQRGNWDTSVSELGQRGGIFKRHGLALELLYTQGSAETLQAVVSGSVGIGVGAGIMGARGAFSQHAPVPVIGAETTGAADLVWYRKAESPIRNIK